MFFGFKTFRILKKIMAMYSLKNSEYTISFMIFEEVISMMVLTLVGMAFIPFLALVGVSAC
ncbi:hypothetical protein EHX26_04790 [Brochothrix thermosphacta]|nr:hypothetical protein [Brochothrix thermosphacta]